MGFMASAMPGPHGRCGQGDVGCGAGWPTRCRRVIAAAWITVASAFGQAAELPLDPWTDLAWRGAMLGLRPGEVRSLRWVEQQFEPREAGRSLPAARRTSLLEFDEAGRVQRLSLSVVARDEPATRSVWRYRHDASGRLTRIELEATGEPLLERHYDASGRPGEEVEYLIPRAPGTRAAAASAPAQTPAPQRRTRLRYDADGRLVERSTEDQAGQAVLREVHEYRSDGTPARQQRRGVQGELLEVEFDVAGRPLRVHERRPGLRRWTAVEYPEARVAVHRVSGFEGSGEDGRRFTREIVFHVRQADELRVAGAPLRPGLRRVTETGSDGQPQVSETRTDFDAQDRPLTERQFDAAGRLVCQSDRRWHRSGLPLSVQTRVERPEPACALEGGNAVFDIGADEHGHWVSQTTRVEQADGHRALTHIQTRDIEYR